jgi:putative ABC transport system permease protein
MAWRSLRGHRRDTAISTIGLAVGLACWALTVQYLDHQFDVTRVVGQEGVQVVWVSRLSEVWGLGTERSHSGGIADYFAERVAADVPDIAAATVVLRLQNRHAIGHGQRGVATTDLTLGDPHTFEVFAYQPVYGRLRDALDGPGRIALGRQMAEKIFDSRDPVGEVVHVDGFRVRGDFTVSAVYEDPPPNPFLRPSAIVSDDGQPWRNTRPAGLILVLLRAGASPAATADRILDVITRSGEAPGPQSASSRIIGIKLVSPVDEGRFSARESYLIAMGIISLLVMLQACINHANLGTAQATRRAKELAMKLTVGATRWTIAAQVMMESALITLTAIVLGVALAELFRPVLNTLLGAALSGQWLLRSGVWVAMAGWGLLAGTAAGVYPALYLSALKPAAALSGRGNPGSGKLRLREGLTVLQCAVSGALILTVICMARQLQFTANSELGFTPGEVIVLPVAGVHVRTPAGAGTEPAAASGDRRGEEHWFFESGSSLEAAKRMLVDHPAITRVAVASHAPPLDGVLGRVEVYSDAAEAPVLVRHFEVDEDFLEVLHIPLVSGAGLTAGAPAGGILAQPGPGESILLNQAALRALGWTAAVGRQLRCFPKAGTAGGDSRRDPAELTDGPRVAGSVADFRFHEIRERVEPLMLRRMDLAERSMERTWRCFMLVEPRPGRLGPAMQHLQSTWNRLSPGQPFEAEVLSERIQRELLPDQRLLAAVGLFSLLAVLLACLGLVSLQLLYAQTQAKAIAIRRVFGGGVVRIVVLLLRDAAWLVGIGYAVGIPLAVLWLNRWMESYAYRVGIEVWVVVVSGAVSMCAGLLPVSVVALRAACAPPIDVLRHE